MADTLDRIIEIIREHGYDRDKTADGSTPLLEACGNESFDALDMVYTIEEEFRDVELPDQFLSLSLGEIAIEIENQTRALRHARAQ